MVKPIKFFLAVLPCLIGSVCFSVPALADASYCREYTKDVVIGGVKQQSYGTACLQPDGSWQIVNNDGSIGPQTVVVQETQVVTAPPVVVQRSPSVYVGVNTGYPYYIGSSHRSHFYHYHRGPWKDKHWQHHRKVLHKDRHRH